MAGITQEKPKIVELKSENIPAGIRINEFGNTILQIRGDTKGPGIGLQLCHETRERMLPHLMTSGDAKIYINPTVDTLYFGPETSWAQVHQFPRITNAKDLSKLKYLRFDEYLFAPFILGIYEHPHAEELLNGIETIELTAYLLINFYDHLSRFRGFNTRGNGIRHCSKCEDLRHCMKKPYRFPTCREFAAKRKLSGAAAIDAYLQVVSRFEGKVSLFDWVWYYVHGQV